MKIYAPPLTTWTCHTLSVRTTNWPTSLTTTTSPWWLTTATCARTSRYRMANSAPNCALTSKAAKSYWWVVHQCRLTDIFHISDSGCFILIADNGDLRDDLKILNVELCLQLCYWWVADRPTSLAMAIRNGPMATNGDLCDYLRSQTVSSDCELLTFHVHWPMTDISDGLLRHHSEGQPWRP